MKLTIRLLKGLNLLLILAVSQLSAQNNCQTDCTLQCVGHLNVSLDQDCTTEITPAMGAIGVEYYCNDYYNIDLYDAYGYHLPSNTLGIEYHGETLTYKVTELECGNSCWGNIYVEYKYPPQIECPEDVTVACGGINLLDLPPATGGCADFEVVLYEQTRTNYNCDDEFSSVVTRTYKAFDSFGNTSYCSHDIYVRRLDIDEIIFPGPATVSCNDTLMRFDEYGIPKPWYTVPLYGYGMADGIPVICDDDVYHGLLCPNTMDHNAVPIIPTGGAVAIVENPDPYGPEYLVEEIGDDNNAILCNAFLTYTDTEIPNVPCKRKILRQWEVIEWWCNRELSGSASQLISIVDDEAPHFHCPPDFTVSTDDDCGGSVYIDPISVYDGCYGTPQVSIKGPNETLVGNGGYIDLNLGHNYLTYTVSDGCFNQSTCHVEVTVEDRQAPVAICETFKVVSLGSNTNTLVFAEPFDNGSWDECGLDRFEVRRMDTLCVASDTLFDESVNFCCSDAGTEVMVVFRAYDWNNNYNDCMVRVEVQDKITPTMECPEDVTIQCQDPYDLNNLGPQFGEPWISDNCSEAPIVETVAPDVNQCGVGVITRFFDVINNDSLVLAHCKQLISVENNVPYLGANIVWPLDYVVEDVCELSNIDPEDLPDGFGFPSFGPQDECTLLGYQYEDKVFSSANGCVHVKRTWNVINWCGSSNGSFDIWTIPEPQLIEIINTTAPAIDDQDDQAYESQDVECRGDSIIVERSATDDCEFLGWYHVLYNEYGDTVQYGLSNVLEAYLDVGNYTVEWRVEDGCGNFDVDFQNLSMTNVKAPTPVCINGLSASLVAMDLDNDGVLDTEMVELWASDFDSGSSIAACGNPIVLSLSSDTTVKNVIFDCEDIGRNEVQLWVTDVVTGYQDYCVSFIDIMDNNNHDVCPDSLNSAVIEGSIYTEELVQVEGVKIGLGDNMPIAETNNDGFYAFGSMPLGGQYELKPELNKDFLDGVSTLDLIMVQRHILGLEKLESPYKLLAADINNDGEISSTDLIELRKLILGINDEYQANTSWRFVDAGHEFVDPLDPWSSGIPETYTIDFLNGSMEVDFIGLKVGDVNASALFNSGSANDASKSNNEVEFVFSLPANANTDLIEIPVYSKNYSNVLGWQIDIRLENESARILSINAAELQLDMDKHVHLMEEGLRISYNNDYAQSISEDEVLFTIEVIQSKPEISGLFALNDNLHMESELYKTDGIVNNIILSNSSDISEMQIVSVSPNPWSDFTHINYELTNKGNVTWEFYNVSGQLLYSHNEYAEAGTNTLRLENSSFEHGGLIYIRMISNNQVNEQKMILLK